MLLGRPFPTSAVALAAIPHQIPQPPTRAVLSGQPNFIKKTKNLADREKGLLHPRCSITEDDLLYKETFIIRYWEVGPNKNANIQTIANFFQEVGCNHLLSHYSTRDGLSLTPTMQKLNLIWVLSWMHMEVHRYPTWNDAVEIETWIQLPGSIHAERDWIVKDYDSGEIMVRATSKWLLINQNTRRLQKLPHDLQEEMVSHCPNPPRYAFPPDKDNGSVMKIEKLELPQISKLGLQPRRADLDMNRHVNNVSYIGWILESMPQNILESHELQRLTIEYKRECQHADVIDSFTSPEPLLRVKSDPQLLEGTGHGHMMSAEGPNEDESLQFRHLLRLSGRDGFEVSRGRTVWRKNP